MGEDSHKAGGIVHGEGIEAMRDGGPGYARACRIIGEYGIYILLIFLFTGKGEAFRSFGLYGPPLAFLMLRITGHGPEVNPRNPVFIAFLLLSGSATLSALLGEDVWRSLTFFKKTYVKDLLLLLTFLVFFPYRDRMERLLKVTAFTSALSIALFFYDYFTRGILPDGTVDYEYIRGASSGLAFYIPFIPCGILISRRRVEKVSLSFLLIVGTVAMLLTGSRGGWISLFLSLSVWMGFFLFHTRRKGWLFILLGGLVVSGLLSLTFIPAPHLVKRLTTLATSNRMELKWKPYVEIYSKSPLSTKLFGHGLDRDTMVEGYHRWYKERIGGKVPPEYNPHNFYLYFLFKQGLLGLGTYLVLVSIFLYTMVRWIRDSNDIHLKAMGLAIILPFLGEYVVRGMVEDLRFMPLGILLGMGGAYIEMVRRDR